MPLCAGSRLRHNEALYFDSLLELDLWATAPSVKLKGILDYRPRRPVYSSNSGNRGKLLVCHDYKGGYTESPFSLSYTFNFWPLVDTFVYFSHHRVTIPPPAWITAAHRHGVRILGTLIFENSGTEDCLRLLVGNVPQSKTGPALPSSPKSIPLSSHYACLLAELAYQRGFDGYLLNVEINLDGAMEQTQALAAWITLLQSELRTKIGQHAQTIWYDSVVFTGQLLWQDRLNSRNLPFFLASTAIFTNYTWPRHYPNAAAQYFLSLDPNLTGGDLGPTEKSLGDIFMGVDVWGRGSHGGGGFGLYKALSHIDPESLGLSVALFGQAWTWESEQDKPGWTWEQWWDYERKLWIGPTSKLIGVPEAPKDERDPDCIHGPFLPISSFFPRSPPPNPADLAFHTMFCPGVGRAWFVEGVKVLQSVDGWTDIDKQCSVGDMVWPHPSLAWEDGDWSDQLPEASTAFCFDDAWNGGSSLRLDVSTSIPRYQEDAIFRCLWLPVQSLSITSGKSYEASVVFKLGSAFQVDVDFGLSVKVLQGAHDQVIKVTDTSSHTNFSGGWTRLSVHFSLSSDPVNTGLDTLVAVGFIIGYALDSHMQPFSFSFLVGQLNVFPIPPPQATRYRPIIFWADFHRPSADPTPGRITGILSWDAVVSLAPLKTVNLTSPDDPIPIWTLDMSDRWFPSYLYFNIYMQAHPTSGPESAIWIGTTGLDGLHNRFAVDVPLSEAAKNTTSIRLFIQGVTDHGEVLPWQQCVFVDINIQELGP